ncbi:MAG: SAM-dependent methyltransferase, partial [Shewanella sp.]
IRAKRFLLESGIFAPLVEQLALTIVEYYQPDMSLLDFECADGFYLRALAAELALRCGELSMQWVGVADAENAIFAAAKAQTPGFLCLTTSKVLPFADNSLDLVTVIDKPLKGKELLRVLKEQGILLLVTPGPRHLWQLKQYLYRDLKEKSQYVNLPSGLSLKDSHPVRFTLDVTGEQALSLLEMTPYAWRATDKMKHDIKAQRFTALEVDFLLVIAQKTTA